MQIPPCSLYIHIPWCLQKCVYCDFNSATLSSSSDQKGYIEVLLKDLQQELKLFDQREINSIFIGGGTPTILSAENIKQLLEGIFANTKISRSAEITIEANPETLNKEKLKVLFTNGVNRISFGVQTFADQQLQFLKRAHSSAKAIQVIQTAQEIGFKNINIDLMFGLPQQSNRQMLDDINKAVQLKPTHISHYQLTLEPNTPLAVQNPTMPNEEQLTSMYAESRSHLQEHGFINYETSAFAKPGFECQHNINYWQFGDFIGIGAGAHGKQTIINNSSSNQITRYSKPNDYLEYIQQIASNADSRCSELLSEQDIILDFMINAMRLNTGWDKQLFIDRTGLDFATLEPKLKHLSESGLILLKDSQIQPTAKGRMLLDEILGVFV